MNRKHSELRELGKSFSYAMRGFLYCIKNERNMRIHIVLAVLVFAFSIFFKLSRLEYILLVLVVGMVLLCEIINTAIEALVNLSSPAYNSLAKVAKDVAAGAVFVSSLLAVLISFFMFFKIDRLCLTFRIILTNFYSLTLFVVIILLGILFIFKSFKLKISDKVIGSEEVKIYKPKKNRDYIFK